MNTVPITFSLPIHLKHRLNRDVPSQRRSQFVSEAIEAKLTNFVSKDPWEDFLALGKSPQLPNLTTEQILENIHKDRK